MLRVNHYDFVALHSMWIIFLKGYCVLVRVEILCQAWVRFLPEDLIVDEFFSTVPGKNFDLCIITLQFECCSFHSLHPCL